MPLRKKITGLKKGSKGYVYKIPIAEIEKLSEEDINKELREIFGTNEVRIGYNRAYESSVSFKKFLEEYAQKNKDGTRNTWETEKYNGDRYRRFLIRINKNRPAYGVADIEVVVKNKDYSIPDYRTGHDWDYFLIKNDGKNITIRPFSVMHGITAQEFNPEDKRSNPIYHNKTEVADTYADLTSILRTGFKVNHVQDENVSPSSDKDRLVGNEGRRSWARKNEQSGITKGDAYTIEFIPTRGSAVFRWVEYARPENILSVNIELDDHATEEQKQEKIDFYKKNIGTKYNIPIRFLVSDETGKHDDIHNLPFKRVYPKKSLEHRLSLMVGISAFAGSLFYLRGSIIGNAIGNISPNSGAIIGIILFTVGLSAFLFYFHKK